MSGNVVEPTSTEYLEHLREEAKKFEIAWLLPKKHDGEEFDLRLRLNGGLSGWQLKEALVSALGLEPGDTVNTEASVLLGPGLLEDSEDIDLFAGGNQADWLLNSILEGGFADGCVIDCRARLVYVYAPVGGFEGKTVGKAALILSEGKSLVDSADALSYFSQY